MILIAVLMCCWMVRIAFVGAREGQFPAAVSFINYTHFTPVPAVIVAVSQPFHQFLFSHYIIIIIIFDKLLIFM